MGWKEAPGTYIANMQLSLHVVLQTNGADAFLKAVAWLWYHFPNRAASVEEDVLTLTET